MRLVNALSSALSAALVAAFFAAWANAGWYDYSTTAASNTTVDGVSVPVGALPPSNVGPVIRAMAASNAAYLDDSGCAVTSSGTDTITFNAVSNPYSGAATYADGDTFCFIAGGTNTGAATFNVDSEGAKAIRKGADAALVGGELVTNGMYTVHYDASANGASGAFLLETPALPNTLELGHASDTTLSRSAAGVLQVESVTVPTQTSSLALTGKSVTSNTSVITIADDAATTITFTGAAAAYGVLVISGNESNGEASIAAFRVGTSPFADELADTGSSQSTTGALTGTTGSDGFLTISAHTDSKLYIENRTGSSRNYNVTILSLLPGTSISSIP